MQTKGTVALTGGVFLRAWRPRRGALHFPVVADRGRTCPMEARRRLQGALGQGFLSQDLGRYVAEDFGFLGDAG